MKLETIKLKKEFVGRAWYESLGQSPSSVFGQRGQYQRHIVSSEAHGQFHVITPASSEVIPYDAEIEIVNPVFYSDYLNGRNVQPAFNVYAEKIVVVK